MILSIREHDSNHLDDSNDQRTESNGTKVISEKSIDTLSDSTSSRLTSTLREIPETDGAGDDELSGSEDEGVEPEETEQVIDQQSLELHVIREGDEGGSGVGGFLFTSTDQVQGGDGPVDVEGDEDEAGEGREEEDGHGLSNVVRGSLHDSDGQSDSVEQAEDGEESQNGDSPQAIADNLQRKGCVVVGFVVSGSIVNFFLVFTLLVESPTENGSTSDETEDSDPGQDSGAVSQKNHVDEPNNKGAGQGNSDNGPGGLDITEPLL